jgi:RNA polymerase sigma factor for flagellar operon FliA
MTATARPPHELVAECQGLVVSLATKIHHSAPPQVELDDLVAYGQVGLAEAARDFDASKGIRFSTYAYYRIRGAIYDGLAKMAWFSRAQYNRMRFERLAAEAMQVDAADTAAVPPNEDDDLRWFKRLTGVLAVVHLASRASDEDDDASSDSSFEDTRTVDPHTAASEHEICERVRNLIEKLPPDAASLMKTVYFEGLSLKEAGERLGIGKAWASRLHARNLERLARAFRRMGVDP